MAVDLIQDQNVSFAILFHYRNELDITFMSLKMTITISRVKFNWCPFHSRWPCHFHCPLFWTIVPCCHASIPFGLIMNFYLFDWDTNFPCMSCKEEVSRENWTQKNNCPFGPIPGAWMPFLPCPWCVGTPDLFMTPSRPTWWCPSPHLPMEEDMLTALSDLWPTSWTLNPDSLHQCPFPLSIYPE